jgi:predicted O-methyltransferase YrrM
MKIIILKLLSIIVNLIPKRLLGNRVLYDALEKRGFHITENHFYQPIPDSRDITENIFNKEISLKNIYMNDKDQFALMDNVILKYKNEYSCFPYNSNGNINEYYYDNGFFVTVDAELLYCMIRHNKPKNIIEIGSGMSTIISAMAIRKNKELDPGYKCNLICIEPYPKEWLYSISEISKLIKSKVEDLPLETFSILGQQDILFIDSSHIIKIYNDVCYEYMEVLPTLNVGVIVHIHDIVLPKIYSKYWYPSFFWNEQYLLYAFLAFNRSFKVMWAGNYMHLNHPHRLEEVFPSYSFFKNNVNSTKRQLGHKSFWMQRIA